jgi:glutamate N-acetyltransferase/amino-acid N-acetyltransferase
VKTAVAGSDPNWGRILSAAGNAGVAFDPRKAGYRHARAWRCAAAGLAARFSEAELKQKLDAPECEIRLTMRGKAKGEARFWTCDLHGRLHPHQRQLPDLI